MPDNHPHKTLDQEVCEMWDALVFPSCRHDSGPRTTREEYDAWLEGRKPLWREVLGKCMDGPTWLVNAQTAVLITTQFWFTHMSLKEYAEARISVERCLLHPGPFDRMSSAELPIRLLVARLGEEMTGDVPRLLEQHIDCGIYSRSEMAAEIALGVGPLLEDFDPEMSVPLGLWDLADALAAARKMPATRLARTGRFTIRSLMDLLGVISNSKEPTRPKPNNRHIP